MPDRPMSRLHLLAPDDARRGRPKPLGIADAGACRTVALPVADARHHLHVIGATGTGKSTLLTHLILADVAAGRGVAVLDPKGDLVTDVLARLPKEAAQRLVLIDPDEADAPAALNVLDTTADNPELVADRLVGVFARLYASYWGPRIEDVLRCATLTLTRQRGVTPTLADIPELLANPRYRAAVRDRLTDETGLAGFWSWYDGLTEAARAQVIGPVMTKLRGILARRFAVDLLGASSSSFSMTDVLDGGILLARLPKGVLGDDTSRLVGSLLLSALWQHTTARAARPEDQRLDAAVYVDECHNFMHLPGPIDDVLAEARGYRLSLVLAHQHLGQLPRELADAVHANARNKAFFTVSPDDARILARHVGPYLTSEDLARLGRYQLACRLVVHGRDSHGFTLLTRPPAEPPANHTLLLRAAARGRGRTAAARRDDQLARQLRTADARPTRPTPAESAESVFPSVLTPVSQQVWPSALDTGTDTDGCQRPNPHVSGPDGPPLTDSDS